jgi:hypothetical protein
MAVGIGRRELVIGAGGAVVASVLPLGLWGHQLPAGSLPRPFSATETMRRFCWPLLAFSKTMPEDMRRRLQGVVDACPEIDCTADNERPGAERIAMIAVRVFAPRALRRAGYHDHAAECESAVEIEAAGRAACLAQHTIGMEHRDAWLSDTAQSAYGAAGHAANAIIAAASLEERWLPDAGERAASALLCFDEAPQEDDAERSWVWPAALGAIASCMSIGA